MEVTELYTPFYQAFEELERRQSDADLRRSVDAYFRDSPPPPELARMPRAVMSPSLVTPNLEMEYLMDVWRHVPVPPLFLEFSKDKFVHLNAVKRSLGEMTFYRQDGSGRKQVSDSIRVVDFQEAQGRPMDEIKTLSGESFPEFHHRIFRAYFKDIDAEIGDFSDWFRAGQSFDPAFPYLRYLGLFLIHGVLFANFTLEKRERAFTETFVLPAFAKLKEAFGVAPLIVPIESIGTDDQALWCYYPEHVRALL
jgi:hypothetical protein